jgi:hypothetical protein
VTPKQFCAAIQNPYLGLAVAGLAKLLPTKFQPSKTIKIVIGAVVAKCPLWAKAAAKVHEAFVQQSPQAPPTATVYAPVTSLMADRTMDLSTGTAYAFVSWSGVGVDSYQEQTNAAGSLDPPLIVGALSPSVWRPVAPGGVYRFFVRGLNAQKQSVTSWAKSAEFTLKALDTTLNGSGWTTASPRHAYGGTIAYTTLASAGDITYTPDGFAMAIVAPTLPKGGSADVFVDGTYARTISFYSPSVQTGRLIFSWTWFSGGQHHVVLRPRAGEIDLDAELVLSFA